MLSRQVDAAGVGNSGTGKTEVFTYTVPGGTLSRTGQTLRVSFFLAFAANANTKKVTVEFGSDEVRIVNAAVNLASATGLYTALIVRSSASAQLLLGSGPAAYETTAAGAGYIFSNGPVAGTQDNSTQHALKISLQGGASNDIICYGMLVEVLG